MKTKRLFGILFLGAMLILAGCGGQVATEPPQGKVIFLADPPEVQAGNCTVLVWDASSAFEVRLDGELVTLGGNREVCPSESSMYVLEVDLGTSVDRRELEVKVIGTGEGPAAGVEPEPQEQASSPGPVVPGVPAYQSEGWISLGGPPGGLGYDIRMHPDNPDIMYVTDAFTGFFKSMDGGANWFPINAGIETSPGAGTQAFCVTIDPHDYNTIWGGLQLFGHIYRSTNGGESWEQRDTGLRFEDCLRSIRGITIDPNDQNTVYAGVEVDYGCKSKEKPPHRQALVYGEVYKSTDGGANWKVIWEGENLARYIWIDPRNSNRLYVSTGLFDRDAANSNIPNGVWGGVGILRSDDGGNTWTVLDEKNGLGGLYVPSLFMHPEDPDTLLAAVTYPADPGGEGVYVTRNGGDSWTKILSAEFQWAGMEAVEIAIADPDIWYAAAENTAYRSEDAGKTWERFALETPDRKGGSPIDLEVDPRDPRRIFQNAYGGGNVMSNDGGETWVDASHGYTGARVDAVTVSPDDSATVFASSFRSNDGGQTWSGLIDNVNAHLIHQGADGDYFLFADGYANVYRSADDGETWETVKVVEQLDEPYNAALALSPSDPQTVYIGYVHNHCPLGRDTYHECNKPMPGLFRSRDGGRTWEQINAPYEGAGINEIVVHPQNPQRILVGTTRGLYGSTDEGQTWDHVEEIDQIAKNSSQSHPDLSRLEGVIIFDIAVDPFDPKIVLVAADPGAVIRSTDGGLTWQQTASGMDPNEPVADLLFDPVHQNVIYAASRFSGVFVSTDGGNTWVQINSGLFRKEMTGLGLSSDGSVLYAGTASGSGGSGVYRLGTPAGAQP
jgi:photosystem II stability/assembly factor-like uncharacterized protein